MYILCACKLMVLKIILKIRNETKKMGIPTYSKFLLQIIPQIIHSSVEYYISCCACHDTLPRSFRQRIESPLFVSICNMVKIILYYNRIYYLLEAVIKYNQIVILSNKLFYWILRLLRLSAQIRLQAGTERLSRFVVVWGQTPIQL